MHPRPQPFELRHTLLAVALLGSAVPAAAQLDPARVGWTRSSYTASKFGLSSNSEVTLKTVSAAETTAALIASPQGQGLLPHDDANLLLWLDNRALGRDSHLDLWLDPKDATAYQRSQFETGKKRGRYKVVRFTQGGAFSRRLLPEKGEEKLPRERWSDVIEEYDRFDLGHGAVTEPAALFYVVAAARLDAPGDRVEMRVLSSHQIYTVEITVAGRERLEVDHVVRSTDGERRVQGLLETLRLVVHPRLADGKKGDDFKFLGIEGDVELHLDPQTRALVQISGKAPYAGKLRFVLTEVVLASPTPTSAP